jgi:hypothetical protein
MISPAYRTKNTWGREQRYEAQYKRGLRHGDPISPYLSSFLWQTCSNVLFTTRLSQCDRSSHRSGPPLPGPPICRWHHRPSHRSTPPLPGPSISDDTLILLTGDLQQVTALKNILDKFALVTGLSINFHKSTFVPMNLSPDGAANMAVVLGCQMSFPQTYLCLPLSPHKLREVDCQPLIAKFDKYLAGWKAWCPVGTRQCSPQRPACLLHVIFPPSHLSSCGSRSSPTSFPVDGGRKVSRF